MPQSSSSHSPLAFARDYQAYRQLAMTTPFADARLLAAARFWLPRHAALGDPSYESYWREDLPTLLAVAPDLQDLLPAELEEIAAFLEAVSRHLVPAMTADTVWEMAARGWMYVGEAGRAWAALRRTPYGADMGEEPPTVICDDALELPQGLIDALAIAHSEEPRASVGSAEARHTLMDWLVRFDARWQADRESAVANEALCALIEYDGLMRPVRGRLRRLRGAIESIAGDNGADQVVFAHQLRGADDTQISGAYAALTALRELTRRSSSKAGPAAAAADSAGGAGRSTPSRSTRAGQAPLNGTSGPESRVRSSAHGSPLRGHFEFLDHGRELYGGDSLGFACLATAFGDHWSRTLHRERRLISADVALSGALEPDGRAAAISEASLARKVERVFFSPISALALPEANRAAAEALVETLRLQHPARRLRIIGIERAADLIADHYIFLPERVCLGEYAVLAAAKYGRSVKVQAPAFAVLCLILGWLVWPWLRSVIDDHIVNLEQRRNGIVALNRYGRVVWDHVYLPDTLENDCPKVVYDLDRDGKNEAGFYVSTGRESQDQARIDIFNHDGTLRFRLDARILGQYPGDYEGQEVYTPGLLQIVEVQGAPLIITGANGQNPSRFHVKIWSAQGELLGWYVNAGVVSQGLARDFDGDGTDDLVFPGYNIRMRSVALFVLKARGSEGVSPPYQDEQYDMSRVIPGNQMRYMLFPPSDLTLVYGYRIYNSYGGIYDVSSVGMRLNTREGGVPGEDGREMSWQIYYYLDDSLRVNRVDVEDAYKARREMLVREGKLPDVLWPEYFRDLQAAVRGWDGTGWVPDSLPKGL
ncbi:MAG TPA: hypothetical protein VNN55_01485 [bacterium]|nr:hypothetical protein [bacterium]